MIILVQFGINKHSQIFKRLQIALHFFVVLEKFARSYLFQIALEISWLPIQNEFPKLLLGSKDPTFSASVVASERFWTKSEPLRLVFTSDGVGVGVVVGVIRELVT